MRLSKLNINKININDIDHNYSIQNIHAVNDFLMQDVDEKFTYEEVLEALKQLFPEDE